MTLKNMKNNSIRDNRHTFTLRDKVNLHTRRWTGYSDGIPEVRLSEPFSINIHEEEEILIGLIRGELKGKEIITRKTEKREERNLKFVVLVTVTLKNLMTCSLINGYLYLPE
jgi:hypothetical protein